MALLPFLWGEENVQIKNIYLFKEEKDMVIIPKEATAFKKKNPNRLNKDGSITINDQTFKAGSQFNFACVRKPGTPWGTMFRNGEIVSITPIDDENTIVLLKGSSDFLPAEATCKLKDIV